MRSKSFKVLVQITVKVRQRFGAIIESKEYKQQYVSETLLNWIREIECLFDIAKAFPHEAYPAVVFGY